MATSPALGDSTFTKFERNNVDAVTGAEMTLPAPLPAFEVFCVAAAATQPYRLAIHIDPENSSYTEIDRSDRADPHSPQTWTGKMDSIGIGMYFPKIDGITTGSFAVRIVHISGGLLRLEANTWSYWRNNLPYDCVSSAARGGYRPI